MGPENPFVIMGAPVVDWEGDLRWTEITYPDGMELCLRFPLPHRDAGNVSVRIPASAFLTHMASETDDDDGQLYGHLTYWIAAADLPRETPIPAQAPGECAMGGGCRIGRCTIRQHS